eukprot:15337209-Ditylum_brightwellii.AAC.1
MFLKVNFNPVDHPHPDDYSVIIGSPRDIMGVGDLDCITISQSLYRTYNKLLPDIYQVKSQKHWSCIFDV